MPNQHPQHFLKECRSLATFQTFMPALISSWQEWMKLSLWFKLMWYYKISQQMLSLGGGFSATTSSLLKSEGVTTTHLDLVTFTHSSSQKCTNVVLLVHSSSRNHGRSAQFKSIFSVGLPKTFISFWWSSSYVGLNVWAPFWKLKFVFVFMFLAESGRF